MAISVRAALDDDSRFNGLLSGQAWEGALTFGFPSQPSAYRSGYGYGEPLAGFAPASEPLMEAIIQLLSGEAVSPSGEGKYRTLSVSGITELDVSLEDDSAPGIRIAQSAAPPTAWAYLPSFDEGGDVWFGKAYAGTGNDFQSPEIGQYSQLCL